MEEEGRGWGKTFLLSPHFPRGSNTKKLFRAVRFHSARTGTLATQANNSLEKHEKTPKPHAMCDSSKFSDHAHGACDIQHNDKLMSRNTISGRDNLDLHILHLLHTYKNSD